ncbi:MAG TPA: TIGR03435 family protein [Candidatus Aquilonibacter sp.]|nr:TIGR03435 family protein [Candidatus Aquilonibacter sp.]
MPSNETGEVYPRMWCNGLAAGRRFLVAALVTCAAMLAAPLLKAQTNGNAPLSFEVASIKPAGYHPGYDIDQRGGLYNAVGVTARYLIKYAYNITDDQLSGGPDWINSDKYAINAKIPDSIAAEWQKKYNDEEMRVMVRSLLAGRFALEVSHQTRELPVFALVVAKGGAKISASKDDGTHGGSDGHGKGYVEIYQVTDEPVSRLVEILSRQPELDGRRLTDETGLTATYSYTLKWTEQRPIGEADTADTPDSSAPSLWDALQQQLGLKLESRKAAVDTIVIDRIQKPTPD